MRQTEFDRVRQGAGHGQVTSPIAARMASLQLECDRQRPQRVAFCALMDATQQRSWDGPVEPRLDERPDGAQRQRIERDGVERSTAEASPELRRENALGLGSPREDRDDVLILQPAEREREHARRRGIKPLLVVDRDQDRAGSGDVAQDPQDRTRKGLDVARALRQLTQEKGRSERVLLRIRERVEGRVRKPLEQIAQPRECKHRLWLRGRRFENPEAAPPSAFDRLSPEGRLPDTGVALEDAAGGAGRDRVQQLFEVRPLGVPSK